MQAIITPTAAKQYNKFSQSEQRKIKKKIMLLEQEPFSGKKLDGEFAELRVIRAWPYRIFYYINTSEGKVYITSIRHRQGAYN